MSWACDFLSTFSSSSILMSPIRVWTSEKLMILANWCSPSLSFFLLNSKLWTSSHKASTPPDYPRHLPAHLRSNKKTLPSSIISAMRDPARAYKDWFLYISAISERDQPLGHSGPRDFSICLSQLRHSSRRIEYLPTIWEILEGGTIELILASN